MGEPKFESIAEGETLVQESTVESQEKKEIPSEIVLKFFRHSEKSNAPVERDHDIRLTDRGRDLARAKSEYGTENALAFGSSRDRTKETAGIMMSGSKAPNLEELEDELVVEHTLFTKMHLTRIGEERRLDFNDDFNSPYGKKFFEEFKAGNYLPFLFKESDALAKELGDTEGSTYSRLAGQIAQIIAKYSQVSEKAWHPLMNKENSKYLPGEKLNRFLGTHAGVNECFLAKVIEKTRGLAARDQFANISDKKGFDYVEGFDVSIKQSGAEKHITISYKRKGEDGHEYVLEEEIPEAMLEEIIEEGKN